MLTQFAFLTTILLIVLKIAALCSIALQANLFFHPVSFIEVYSQYHRQVPANLLVQIPANVLFPKKILDRGGGKGVGAWRQGTEMLS